MAPSVGLIAISAIGGIFGIGALLALITLTVLSARYPDRFGVRFADPSRPRPRPRPRPRGAQGLAGAILETLPIVKFGNTKKLKEEGGDIELGGGLSKLQSPAQSVLKSSLHATNQSTTKSATVEVAQVFDKDPKAEVVSIEQDPITGGDGELGCSVCTEDFMVGEDVRILPCLHRFHPSCVDPWLLNVSGTCPLCRHDLRRHQPKTNSERETPSTEAEVLPPPLAQSDVAQAIETETATPEQIPIVDNGIR